ncbi:MAG: hypothetical protein ABL995_17715 [Bryobacteraceae bacterium]
MKRRLLIAGLLAAGALDAQWLHYPTPGLPRLADGKANLKAPAPRAADGKPDFSGLWLQEHDRPCPPGGCADFQASEQFYDMGYGMPGGLPYQPWAAEIVKKRTASNGLNDPDTLCVPHGIIKAHTVDLLRKMIQVPGLLAILNERNASYRQIFTDGRALPADMLPTWNGYSTGRWEGDTLVVRTEGFRDGMWLDRNGTPMSDAAKITEKFRRPNFGTLEVEVTVDDPKVFTKPWATTLRQTLQPDTELLDYICLENEKDIPHLFDKK